MQRKEYQRHLFNSPLGWVAILGSPQGLRRLSLQPTPQEALEGLGPDLKSADSSDAEILSGVQQRLEDYCRGNVTALDNIPLDLDDAPPFFRAAWNACRQIPPGETRSYAWLAAAAGNPLAVRAAGQAMARNRLALVIPCHRVIGSDGGLHGYGAGGLTVKARLLAMERGG
ncbi:MAG: methylated-DNA--[protein]-cysteine S-methyltransferase [SAR202 cluster bacterium]|nr:methylated-DNA--[protein]-cysteine S-methyltransferase [SAR202 cluster bacterium]